MNKRRIVVTGMGAVTPLGNTVQESWAAIRNKESGIDKKETFCRFSASYEQMTIEM